VSNNTVSTEVTAEHVIIEGSDVATGAEAVAPEAKGRSTVTGTQYVPGEGITNEVLQRRVENFLTRQAASLDAKDWQAYIDCFAADGIYWMPVELGQTNWELEPSIFAEDVLMMEIRMRRMLHPNAWSQAPIWGTNHMVGNVIIESAQDDQIQVYSRFQMMELRRDDVRHFGGTYRHTLKDSPDGFKIVLQRVDLMNGQAAYDYVLQAWV
jgi:3-phenylpropionate/cinnamic acid dioxygenase small subunit